MSRLPQSVGSTTGYATVDYLAWPVFAPLFLLMLSGIATSAGSTGCGIKMVRVLILLKQAGREMSRLVHPRAVQPVRLGQAVVSDHVIFAVLAFMLVYGGTIIFLSMLLVLADVTSRSAAVNDKGVDVGAIPVTAGGGTTMHRRDCALIAHRDDLTPVGEDNGNLVACRVCRP